MLVAGIGALALAIVQGHDWGWGSARVVVAFATAAVLVFAVVLRSSRHPSPVLELPLLAKRAFAVAGVGILFFFAGFGAFLLSTVLFLNEVWEYSILTSALAVAPGPLTTAFGSVASARLALHWGQRVVGVAGALLFALGAMWWIWKAGSKPDYLGDALPGLVFAGVGAGLLFPPLLNAPAMTLPPGRFATGMSVVIMLRQIGAALGVAILTAILAGTSGAELLSAFDNAWAFVASACAATAVACLLLASAPDADVADANLETPLDIGAPAQSGRSVLDDGRQLAEPGPPVQRGPSVS